MECCDESLRKDLTRSTIGSLTDKTEDQVLEAIRILAVREENIMVAHVTLSHMCQDRDETIRSFGARLQGQASVCRFTIDCPNCTHKVDYTETILRDVLCRGLQDSDIQLDLLGHTNQDMTLEEIFRFIEAKEAGKRSITRLLDTQAASAIRSTYNKNRKEALVENSTKATNQSKICSYCGQKGHGEKSNPRIRKSSCPAYGHKCGHCSRLHHFDHVCRNGKPGNKKIEHDNEAAIFDSLCAVATSETPIMDHHLYDNQTDTWHKRPSQPQPHLDVSIRIVDDDYRQLGYEPITKSTHKTLTVSAMADTGCQSCLAGIQCIQCLGLKETDLIPVKTKMHTANNQQINILGAIILRISGENDLGDIVETRQLTYVTNESNRLFLSKGACIDLGMIDENFPSINEVKSNQPHTDTSDTPICDSPKRSLPPPIPTELPFSAISENREKLQQYLLDYYKLSTFNVCEHQPLPLMTGPPLRIMIDEDAEPIAVHTPIPVPIHWQDEVKAGLDRDVRLGVIEPVPVGDPVTWCHRMVVCAKKDGKPRQPLAKSSSSAYQLGFSVLKQETAFSFELTFSFIQ